MWSFDVFALRRCFLFLFLVLFYFVQVFGYLSEGKKTDEKKMNYKLERERLSRGRERGREGEREEKGEGIRAREGQD